MADWENGRKIDQTENDSVFDTGENSAEKVVSAAPKKQFPRTEKRNFSVHMGEADYVTGRRYDAVKNAFLSYRPVNSKKKPLRSRITAGGETFTGGRILLAKICLVGGYLRLYLALNPADYSMQKYHHKDCTEVSRYAKTPLMIKLSSDRQIKYALELIDEVMRANGFERDPAYVAEDRAGIFKIPYAKRRGKTKIVYVERPSAETAAADASAFFAVPSLPLVEPAAVDIKLPKRAKITDREGVRVGKVRHSVWYGKEGEDLGEFRKEEVNVFLYRNDERAAYVDGNDNVLSLSDTYMATLRRFRWFPILALLLLLLALLTALSVVLGLYFTSQSFNYAPVLFIADAKGKEWSQEKNLPVFMNETFGDTVIMPGMSGSYRFTFENRNADAITFSFLFSEENGYGIDLVYKLKRDGVYIGGENYKSAAALGLSDMTIEEFSSSVFELEWYWRDNDGADTAAGENGAVYILFIDFSAAVIGGERV